MKICVGLSGGVDSSVAALLLKQQGLDVFAMFMQNWHDADATLHGDCEWEEDRFVAEMVARKIGIPFYFADLSKEYRERVVDYMFAEYEAGRTPNPDVLCNREIKFDAFLRAAEKMGADRVATGHYCRRAPLLDADGRQVAIDGRPQWRILEGIDPNKDQSYFLCQLNQEQLGRALFPIGHLTKQEVREIARIADLPSADKKDSQGICFVGKVDLPTFLQQKLRPAEGVVVEVFDDYYTHSEQYKFVHDTLASLLKVPGEPKMITEYSSEDAGGAAFNNRVVESNPHSTPLPTQGGLRGGLPQWFPSESLHSESVQAGPMQTEQAAPLQAESVQTGNYSDVQVTNHCGDPLPVQSAERREPQCLWSPDGTNHRGNDFDEGKIAALSDEVLMRLSEKYGYSDIKFETERYRSGKRRIWKTRYKENPWGKIVGKHDGAHFFTIGQRKGLNIGGHKDSLFVIATNIPDNIIYVGESHRHKGLSRSCLRIAQQDIHWIRPDLRMGDGEVRRYRVRVRYRQPLQDAWLIKRPAGMFLLFDLPQRGLSDGQFAAWYTPDGEMVGSGVY